MSCAIVQPGALVLPPIAEPSTLPRELKDFRNCHAGHTVLVCGCGSSLSDVVSPGRYITIGVNDVGRLFQPDYLVVLNPRQQFRPDRFKFVEQSRAGALFTQLDLGIHHPNIVRFRLGKFAGADFADPNTLDYTRNSPYLGVCLAVHMGAKRIGLIGVDFTDHHFFAATGRHPLTQDFARIDREYSALYAACRNREIELVNLSRKSRLTALPKVTPEDFASAAVTPASEIPAKKVFFVNYKFLSCGDVFRTGLTLAAADLKLIHEDAYWDDPNLPEKIRQFAPDLLLVVHGRRFSQRWKDRFSGYRSAVWLLDEPYEVDDTAGFSGLFDHVFLNDPNSLHCHRNAHYLPACYDPGHYFYRPGTIRQYGVGFVGGYNQYREELLDNLACRNLLSYVVGGPWRSRKVQALNIAANIPADQTAQLYRDTRIVLNIFRTEHHYNRMKLPAGSLNPRIYEAAACGALPISQHRSELDTLCPGLPCFHTPEEMAAVVERHVRDESLWEQVRQDSIRQFATHTYAHRLAWVLRACFPLREVSMNSSADPTPGITSQPEASKTATSQAQLELPPDLHADWEADSSSVHPAVDGSLLLQKKHDETAGSETGLDGKTALRNLTLEFDLYLEHDSVFIAKIHQAESANQLSNSYHLMCRGSRAYLARHSHIFRHLNLPVNAWFRLSFAYSDGSLVVRKNGARLAQTQDRALAAGYCFLGVKGGTARIRRVRIDAPYDPHPTISAPVEHELLCSSQAHSVPKVSIITTVYDRVECLRRCLQSVKALTFTDYEHIIVADAPPASLLQEIKDLVTRSHTRPFTLATLKSRRNDWGISPATAGLALARGSYVSFLSDDNGYLPNHFEKLVRALDTGPNLGFVYSSCLYAGRAMLRPAAPRPGAIDLGQPLVRRELFRDYLGGTIPFHEFGWDWRMLEVFLQHGVRWRHIDEATFVFRLANYPHLMSAAVT